MEYIGWFFFLLGLVIGVAVIPFGIPGTFVIVADVLIFALLNEFQIFTWQFIGVLLGLSLFVELIEFILGAIAAKKYGSSSWGMWGSVIGGLFGGVIATPISPIIGTIFGAFIGAFIGAFVFEFFRYTEARQALRSGWGAFIGVATGRILKLVIAVVMVFMIAVRVW